LLPQVVGQETQPLLVAAAAAVARGDWAKADRIRALLEPPLPPGVPSLDDARNKRRQ